MRFTPALVATVLTLSVLAAGCGSSSTSSSGAPGASSPGASATAPSATALSSSTTPLASPASSAPASSPAESSPASSAGTTPSPRRIVSLSPSATEDLFAIGAGSQVVAVDSDSNYPANVPKTNLSAYQPNVESIAKYNPDLVVLSDDINNIKAQLTKLSIPVIVEPAATSLADAYQQIQSLGAATGHSAGAAKTVADMKSGIAGLVAKVPKRTTPVTYFHELDNTLYTVSSKTFVGQIYALAGLKDIADPANTKGTAYPQLSAEYLVKADPGLVFLADVKCCQQSAATFAARPGFSVLSAVRNKHVVLLDDDVASRWGPRVVQLLQSIVDAAKTVS